MSWNSFEKEGKLSFILEFMVGIADVGVLHGDGDGPRAEVPGSLAPESKFRDSQFKSRLGIGIGIEIQA